MKKKKGISLIVLIITIIVVIILAAVVILTINKNNPVESAKEATFKEDVKAFQDDLALTVAKEYTDNQGQRDTKISTSDYDEIKKYYIPSFTEKYKDKFIIQDDQLVGTDSLSEKEKTWANDVNITTSGKASDGAETDVNCFLWAEDGTTIIGLDEEKLSGVTKIKIPSKCKVIRSDYAFNGTEDYRNFVAGIESVEISNTVTELGYAAFHNFKNLVSIDLPDSITKIGENSFRSCSSLASITMPNSVTSIGNSAFSGCSSLTNITIPDSVTSIGYTVFEGCSSLTNITYNGTQEQWNSISKEAGWKNYSKIKTITCTDGVITL